MRAWLLAVVACSGRAPIGSCDDDLGGVYVDEAGHRWLVDDYRESLDAYPLFDDFRPGSPYGAPRVLDLMRPEMTGATHRRYTRGGEQCDVRAPLHVSCADDRLEVVTADPAPPAPGCIAALPSTHVERWTRVR